MKEGKLLGLIQTLFFINNAVLFFQGRHNTLIYPLYNTASFNISGK